MMLVYKYIIFYIIEYLSLHVFWEMRNFSSACLKKKKEKKVYNINAFFYI